MPITLQAISRRKFLVVLAGAAAMPKLFAATTKTDTHRFALLADTHINAKFSTVQSGTNMAENLRCVVDELAGLDPLPAAAFVVGDLAHQTGESGDYAAFVPLIHQTGLTTHLTLGNHDQRERFWEAVPRAGTVENRHVAIVKSERANFFVMDSLDQTNKVPGLCGAAQLKWLADTLDAHADKPAITMIHHQPDKQKNIAGLIDADALMNVILPRRHVKAHFFGHTHNWHIAATDGLHLINLPPTAYVFAKERPNGWVDLQLEKDGCRLELHSLDSKHSEAGKPLTLRWR